MRERAAGSRQAAVADASSDLVLVDARVWASPDDPIGDPAAVVVRGGFIRQIGGAVDVPPGVPHVDLGGRILTAGFWNCHVHFTEGVWARATDRSTEELQSALDDMLLSRGFTTVLDLASDPRHTLALARRIELGELRGPEIVTAAAGIRPWLGTPFYVREMVPWYLRWAMPAPATPMGARRTVAAQARRGATITKLFTGSYVEPTRVKPMRQVIARAAVREAHRRGMRVLAHPSNREGTAVALAAGVDALAHPPDETEGTDVLLRDAASRGIRVVPTLHMFAATVTGDDAYLAPIRAALRAFIAAGGRVLFGTDVGYMADRDTLPEFTAMHASGMTVSDILRALTSEPAAFLGRSDLGAVEPGMRAELTVLESDTDAPGPGDLADIHAVIRNGRIAYRATGPSHEETRARLP